MMASIYVVSSRNHEGLLGQEHMRAVFDEYVLILRIPTPW
jgi:hypothetical protein